MQMFQFIHSADIHIDSPLRGLSGFDGAPVEQIRSATRRAFENLVDLSVRESVAFVLIAGDLWDGDWPDAGPGLFFIKQASRLREAASISTSSKEITTLRTRSRASCAIRTTFIYLDIGTRTRCIWRP